MNYSYKSLNIKNYYENSPFFSIQKNFSIFSSKFSHFSSSFILSSSFLHINTCSFNKFTAQVIKSSKTENELSISCSIFKEITTEVNGSIFSTNSKNCTNT